VRSIDLDNSFSILRTTPLAVLVPGRSTGRGREQGSQGASPTGRLHIRANYTSKNSEIGVLKQAADKWNVAKRLRSTREPKPPCTYQMLYTQKSGSAVQFWQELLLAGGWVQSSDNAVSPDVIPPGITLRTGDETTVGYLCAQSFQRAVSDVYTNPPSKIIAQQQSDFLRECGPQCLQFEINY
jgi:hypothetical protein